MALSPIILGDILPCDLAERMHERFAISMSTAEQIATWLPEHCQLPARGVVLKGDIPSIQEAAQYLYGAVRLVGVGKDSPVRAG
jgi:hypothetical protein